MIGSWSNRIIDESRCHMADRHALDTFNPNANYVALGLVHGRHHVTDPHSGREFSVMVRAEPAMPGTGRPAHEPG